MQHDLYHREIYNQDRMSITTNQKNKFAFRISLWRKLKATLLILDLQLHNEVLDSQ